MTLAIKKFLQYLGRADAPESVEYHGFVLPPGNLRTGGPAFQENDYYWKSAEAEANRLLRHFGVSTTTRLLDVGCGAGRLAIGLLSQVGELTHYRGVVVDSRRIQWCLRHITPAHAGFQFVHINIENERYNPHGNRSLHEFSFPFAAAEFDLIYLYSVFSHMLKPDIQLYLGEFFRLLDNQGRIFLTAFVEPDVDDFSINPKNYHRDWKGPLHCVRFRQEYFEQLVMQAGFRIDGFAYGVETDYQSAYYLAKN